MTAPVTPVYDLPEIPFATSWSYYPDQLIAGHRNLVTQPIVLAGGAFQRRGTVLGQQTSFTLAVAAAAGNVGNGALSALAPDAGVEYSGSGALPSYVIKATDPTHFSVTDPEGALVGTAVAGTPFASNELSFTITAGATAFAAGDSLTVTATPGTGTYVPCVKTATDGSQVPSAILADDTDASLGPVKAGAYVAGEFNMRAVIADASWTTPALLVTALRAFGIFLKSAVSAADPT